MKPSKSINSLAGGSSLHHNTNGMSNPASRLQPAQPNATITSTNPSSGPTSPICRCRVMYLGSSVPHITKDGLQGIQEPLKELYPDKASLASGNAGIDSWLSVWSNGILVENVDETGREVKRFFKIDALHYCAAVKYVPQPGEENIGQQQPPVNQYGTLPSHLGSSQLPKFLPLDSPHARQQANINPPIFASILRRTTGIKVLECHAFICKREAAANALVRCCFHAYADTMYAKQIGADVDRISSEINSNLNKNNHDTQSQINVSSGTSKSFNRLLQQQQQYEVPNESMAPMATRRSKSIAALNDPSKNHDNWTPSESSDCNEIDGNYNGQGPSVLRRKSMNEHYAQNGDSNGMDNSGNKQQHRQQQAMTNANSNLQRQQNKLMSKSMHHLNQNFDPYGTYGQDFDQGVWPPNHGPPPPVPMHQQPFYNPIASRVPSYPPQNLIDSVNGGGTLKSIKSMAATSIASTLLRSKKHAKAMSMAQLNHPENNNRITSFHQPPNVNGSTLGHAGHSMINGMMPPVPNMFLHQMQHQRPIVNGSQTMKLPSRSAPMPYLGPPINFEAMTPKEMKKLLKKSAKYGIDPNKFTENGLPLLPLRGMPPMPIPLPPHLPQQPASKSGTMVSQSIYSMDMHDGSDLASIQSSTMMRVGPHHLPGHLPPPPPLPPMHPLDPMNFDPAMKPILVKPNQEFLKSKAGKKWLKQQKEFKKLLPPHLDGLPIVFGPPPIEALEPASPMGSANGMPQPPPNFIAPPPPNGLPMMDSSGYYNPHPFYGPSGRASTASTMLRYSPHSQILHQDSGASLNNHLTHHQGDFIHHQQQQAMYGQLNGGYSGGPSPMTSNHMHHNGAGSEYMNDGTSSMISAAEMNGGYHMDQHQHHHHRHGSHHQKQRNHMVEQSVISLGDENDYEDDEDDGNQQGHQDNGHNDEDGQDRYYAEASHQQKPSRRNSKSYAEQEYERVNGSGNGSQQVADDQGSYSSGIYRRGHLNERAFSYSIQQEANRNSAEPKFNGGNYQMANGSNRHLDDNHNHYQNSNHQDSSSSGQPIYYRQDIDNNSQPLPVNELTARLESQLNMKSFANSRVKSHM